MEVKDRDGLFFEYPRKAGETIRRIVFLPFSDTSSRIYQSHETIDTNAFFTQIQITEKKAAKLVSYNVINRNNTLFAHTGSSSRTISFKSHVQTDALKQMKIGPITPSKSSSKSKFKFVTLPKIRRKDKLPVLADETASDAKQSYDNRSFVKDILITSVTTHAINTVLGPPLIRLKYGNLYEHCLFVCNDVTITNVQERQTPLPVNQDTTSFKVFEVTLTLKEVRSTDGFIFKPNEIKERDGVAGWESVLDGLGYDPGGIEY